MTETYDLRLDEELARDVLSQGEGEELGGLTRKLVLGTDDPLWERLRSAEKAARALGKSFLGGWRVQRRYTTQELESARWFLVRPRTMCDCAGEEYGTTYNYEAACRICGYGRVQRSTLRLDLRGLPKSRDFARTLANDEWLVSDRVARLFAIHGIRGVELRAVQHAGPSRRSREEWFQLLLNTRRLRVAPQTRFGVNPLDWPGVQDPARCPLGHTAGLSLISELNIYDDIHGEADIAVSDVAVGHRVGLLVPAPLVLISGRLRRLLHDERVGGLEMDVVRVVPS